MSGDRQPRPGDRVRVQARATEGLLESFDEETGSGLVIEDDGTHRSFRAPFCSVEVLEPADDPSQDPIGTVRQDSGGAIAVRVFAVHDWPEAKAWTVIEDTDSRLRDAEVTDWTVIGAVPGTAAAEQQQAGEYPGGMTLGQIIGGKKPEPPLSPGQWTSLREAVAEPPMVDASTLFPPPVGTAPRVFKSDGPEPPEDVTVIISVHCSDYPFPYFVRFADGWVCCQEPESTDPDATRVRWDSTQYFNLGSEFMEVRR